MTEIDFSPKHEVLIRYRDGTLRPMDEPHYEAELIGENTWKIMSSGDCHYLLAGDEEGVAIDTGYGAGNLRAYLESLCGKPVRWVINTHHHFDHTANNVYFDCAFMGQAALGRASIPYPSFSGIHFPRNYPKKVVVQGSVIPLKGRELEIFELGDHTEDGIAILDRRSRILFTGDELMPGMKTLNGSVKKWKRDLDRIAAHRKEFDLLYGGSGRLEGEVFDIFHEAAGRILAGVPSNEPEPPRRPPLRFPEPVEGHIVYDCQLPHPEDCPPGGFFRSGDTMKNYIFKGYRFTYDTTRVGEADQ